jgi:hypothetical protein
MASSDSPWASANVVVPTNSIAPVVSDGPWTTKNATLDAPAANYGDGYWKGVNTLIVDPPSNGGSLLDGPWKTVNIDISTKHTPIGIKTSKGVIYCEILIKSGNTLV